MSSNNTNGLIHVNTGYYSYTNPVPFIKRLLFGYGEGTPYCENCGEWIDVYDRTIGIAANDDVLYKRTESDLVKSLLANDWGVLDTADRVYDWALQPAIFLGFGRCEQCDGPFTVLGEIHGKASNGTIYLGTIFIMEIEKYSGLILLEKAIELELISNDNRYLKAVDFCKNIGSTKDFTKIKLAQQRKQEARLFGARGMKYLGKGKLGQAEINLTNALNIFEELRDQEGIAITYMNLGIVYQELKNIDNADKYYKMSLAIFEQLNSKSEIALICGLLGSIYYDKSDFNLAEEYFEKAVEIEKTLGNNELIAKGLHSLGNTYLSQNKRDQAKYVYSQALILYQDINNKKEMKNVQANLKGL